MIRDVELEADRWMRVGVAARMAIEVARQEAERLAPGRQAGSAPAERAA